MKVYIAGKITGDPNYKEKFAKAAAYHEPCKDIVLNPAILPAGMHPNDYMKICLSMIDAADFVAFLPDYRNSRGAMLEWSYCKYVGKPMVYMQEEST